jgi:acetyl-CoA carboxylase carboxyl transferase subunit beta
MSWWWDKPKRKLQADQRRDVPADVFEKCPQCGEILYRAKLAQNLNVCPQCGFHLRIGVDEYVRLLMDAGEWIEHDQELRSADPLGFIDKKPYQARLAAAEAETGRGDAVVTGIGRLGGIPICLGVMDFNFIGGSMGSVVGEKLARIARVAEAERRPLVIVSASGGARMMEGILSLMQMAKTSSVLARLHEAGIPYVSILTDPTTGGVTASFSMLGDLILAEPGALIGFAGPRVIEQTIKQELPQGFQRSEFLLEHGMVDAIVDRRQLKQVVARLLRHMLGLPGPEAEETGTAVAASAAAVVSRDGGAPAGARQPLPPYAGDGRRRE